MKSIRIFGLVATLVVGVAPPARADGFITPFAGYSFGGDAGSYCVGLTTCEDKRINLGVSFGVTRGIFGFEEDLAYAPSFFGKGPNGDNGVLTAMSNLLVILPFGPIRPYGLIGVGLIRPHVTFNTSQLDLQNNSLGYDIGGGINAMLTSHVGVRGDVRRFKTFDNATLFVLGGEKVSFWRASAGLTFSF